jgi:tetratricopeptide (TPR) repeat protein
MQTTPGRKWRTPTGAGGNAKAWYLQAAKYLIKAGNFKEAEKLMDERYFHEEDLMIELAGAYEDKGMLNEAGETFLKYRSIRAGKKEETDALAEAKRLFTGAENKDGLKKVAEGYTGYGKWEEAVRIYFAIGEMPAARKTALLAAKHFIERGEGHYFNEKFEMVDNLLTKTGATPDQRADFHRELISAIEKRRDNLTKFRELCTVYERLFGLMKKERIDGPETEAQVREKLLELYMNMGETEKAMEVIG